MGTPDFAVATVDAIAKAGHEIVLVVTQPDKPRGRGKESISSRHGQSNMISRYTSQNVFAMQKL